MCESGIRQRIAVCRLCNWGDRNGGAAAVWENLQEAYHNTYTSNMVISVFISSKKINTQPKDHELFIVNRILIVKKKQCR